MTVLCTFSLYELKSLTSLAFEPDSKLREISERAVSGCSSLKSICLPASVEVLGVYCFSDLAQLSLVTFESGSKLREMKEGVFANCPLLKSIFLPASVPITSGSPFIGSSIDEIHVDDANPYCFVSGEFLITYHEMKLIRYFGMSANVTIPQEYEAIGKYCFTDREQLSTITFEDNTRLIRLDDYAFFCCSALGSICIPAGVKSLGALCFDRCENLSQVTFESGSQLTEIGSGAFASCFSLKSICVPALVEFIAEQCFAGCTSLSTVSFESGAKLSRIGYRAFMECQSLRHFTIPGQLEVLESKSFYLNPPFVGLTFEIPSRMRRLCLPRLSVDCLSIPDSVEFISGLFETVGVCGPLLQFGPESRLTEIDFYTRKCGPSYGGHSSPGQRIFVCLPGEVLRRFRIKFEGA
jgi:hypothetical protein